MINPDSEIKTLSIPADLDGLLQAAEIILPPKTAEPVLEAIQSRQKWEAIKARYQELTETMLGKDAIYQLSNEYFCSTKTIEAILYTR